MSTKIPNGFRFRSADFGAADTLIRNFRSQLEPLHLAEKARVYGELALRQIDGAAAAALRPEGRGAASRSEADREWAKLVAAARDYVDRFGSPGSREAADLAEAALAMRGPFDPEGLAPAVPSEAALSFLSEAAAMDPGLLPALDAAGDRPMSAAWAQVSDRQRQIGRTRYRDPAVDFEFDIDLFLQGQRLYGIVRSERAAWVGLWMGQPEVEEFRYWDGDDPPEGISDMAWAARGRAWDSIMPSGIPARSCWTASLVDPLQDICREDLHLVLEALPPLRDRIQRVARDLALGGRMRAVGAEGGSRSPGEVVNLVWEASRWLRGKEGAAAIEAARAEVEPLLKAELTVGDLLNGVAAAGPRRRPGLRPLNATPCGSGRPPGSPGSSGSAPRALPRPDWWPSPRAW